MREKAGVDNNWKKAIEGFLSKYVTMA